MSTHRPEPVTEPPLSEGRFQLLEVIGEGGMATVYRAFDQRLQRPRAIKILSPAFAHRPALRRRFLSEAQTMANLENARVVRIFDMGEDADRVFIVMELLEGGSLVDRVRDHGPLPPRMAAHIAIEICEAIHLAHEAGVIHRDIKPHNILLTLSGEVRVTDFGIAQVQHDDKAGMTRTGAVLGTWGFMAPEQKTNAKQVDARADVYSIGGTLWSLLKNDTPPELFISDPEPEWYEGVPEAMVEVIQRATRYRREDRYPSAAAMAAALREALPLLPEDPPDTATLASTNPVAPTRVPAPDSLAQFDAHLGRRVPAQGTMIPEGQGAPPSVATLHLESGPSEADQILPQRRAANLLRPALLLAAVLALTVAAVTVGARTSSPALETVPAVTTPIATPPAPPPSERPLPELPPLEVAPSLPEAEVTAPLPRPVRAAPPPRAAKVEVPEPGVAEIVPLSPVELPEEPVKPLRTKLKVTGPQTTSVGNSLVIEAKIDGVYVVKLNYRKVGGPYNQKLMGGNGTYTATLKVSEEYADGIEYFVTATDRAGNKSPNDAGNKPTGGSATSPYKITVTP